MKRSWYARNEPTILLLATLGALAAVMWYRGILQHTVSGVMSYGG